MRWRDWRRGPARGESATAPGPTSSGHFSKRPFWGTRFYAPEHQPSRPTRRPQERSSLQPRLRGSYGGDTDAPTRPGQTLPLANSPTWRSKHDQRPQRGAGGRRGGWGAWEHHDRAASSGAEPWPRRSRRAWCASKLKQLSQHTPVANTHIHFHIHNMNTHTDTGSLTGDAHSPDTDSPPRGIQLVSGDGSDVLREDAAAAADD